MSLPKQYVQLDYIETNGKQCINTTITPKGDWSIEYTFARTSASTTNGALWCARGGSATSRTFSTFLINGTSLRFDYYYQTTSASTINDFDKHVVYRNKNNSYVDGVLTTTETLETFTCGNYLKFFATYTSSYTTNSGYANVKCYGIKIWDSNDELSYNFIPSMRLADGVIGLYDLLNDVFYTNGGSGTFTRGEIVDAPNNIYITNNPQKIYVEDDIELEAYFRVLWNINIDYDHSLGSASYSWLEGNNAVLVANPNDGVQFLGWYYESEPISTELSLQVEVNHDVTYEARFEPIYNVTTSVVGNGSVQFERQTNKNIIVVSVIPSANWSFEKYVVDGVEYTQTPLPLQLEHDVSIVAHFVEDDRYHISVSTNVPNGTIYVSNNDDYVGYSATLWARPIPNYVFDQWDDGNTDNPREIVVNENLTFLARYTKVAESNGIYQYRCFIKDQMALTQAPKSFMVVDSFDIKKDLMTNAKSTIKVIDLAMNVNNGDVLVLYNPKGDVLYQGVITAIQDKTITCSQMQSFYKGTWIYNTNPKTTLEEEISVLLKDYADGKMFGSSYIDPLVAQRLGGITIDFVGSTSVSLPTDTDDKGNLKYTTMDMEKFIYSLYEDYGIMFDFEINFSGTNYVHIKVPTFDSIKVGNNMYAIQNMSPIETIEETNRLIVYSANHQYRKTYVATRTGIVEEPTTTANRFDITNTKIVASDDELADLVANNLPSVMYNHRLTFDLVLKNFIYQFDEFHLGMPLDVWYGSDYYNSVLTGYEMKKASNKNVTIVSFVCGKVRQKLTQLLNLGKV